MREIVLFIAALLFMAVPVMAATTVEITCSVGDANWVTIDYNSTGLVPDGNLIRAFGLDITVPDGNIKEVNVLDPNYRIYPGQIDFVVGHGYGDVNTYGTPYALSDLNDANLTIEMGSLYTTDLAYATDPLDPNNDRGYMKKPQSHGHLLKFRIANACTYTVDVNARRGGVVMEDPYDNPSFGTHLCDGTLPCYVPPVYKDFGDANDSYKTLLVSDGARHAMAGPTTGNGPILSYFIDSEANGQPSPDCNLDDFTGPTGYPPGDENGVTNFVAVVNEGGSVTVTVSNAPPAGAKLDAWIDWGKDGSFAGDQVFNTWTVFNGPQVLTFTVPAGAGTKKNTPLVSRWRISNAGGLSYTGDVNNGEVEDYNKPTVVCHVPDVVGEANLVAKGHLEDAGFVVSTTSECNGTVADDHVIRTDPVHCNYPDCGSTVIMVVSKNPPPPGAASGPTPVHGATCVAIDANLTWTPGAGTVTQDVYWGTTNPPPSVASGVPVGTTLYDPPGNMSIYTCYYWRIDELNACGGKTTGSVWRFRTGPTNKLWPCCATCLGDQNNDGWAKTDDMTALSLLLKTASGNRYSYTSPKYNACGDINQDGWDKTDDITAIGIMLKPLSGNRKKCPTCP